MYIVIGQMAVSRSKEELESVARQLKQDNPERLVAVAKVQPLSWCLVVEFSPEEFSELSAEKTFAMVKNIAVMLGGGTFYFRATPNRIDDFWDSGLPTVFVYSKVLRGLPLSITVTPEQTCITVHFSWVAEFIAKNLSSPMSPVESECETENKLRLVLDSVTYLLSVKGDWVFQVVQEGASSLMSPAKLMARVNMPARSLVN